MSRRNASSRSRSSTLAWCMLALGSRGNNRLRGDAPIQSSGHLTRTRLTRLSAPTNAHSRTPVRQRARSRQLHPRYLGIDASSTRHSTRTTIRRVPGAINMAPPAAPWLCQPSLLTVANPAFLHRTRGRLLLWARSALSTGSLGDSGLSPEPRAGIWAGASASTAGNAAVACLHYCLLWKRA